MYRSAMRRRIGMVGAGVVGLTWAVSLQGAGIDLTFFGWSDQHVRTDGSASAATYAAAAAMNNLPGKAYPASVGGTVGSASFVFGAGDMTEWPTYAALNTYKSIEASLKYPSYDIAGNHDDGGLVPSTTVTNWLTSKYGGLNYTFTQGGVHFVATYSQFDASLPPEQPIDGNALSFIRTSLAGIPKGEPVVVATHLCYGSITNTDALVDSFGDSNVVLVLGGHYHQPGVDQYRGVNFVQLPSPESDIHAVTAVHITNDRLTAIPYNYDTSSWMTGGRAMLDTPISVPEPAVLGCAAVGGFILLARKRG